ncbi:GIY-YIG nuclease family protein [Candidatus Microgenomates bacterium]|nr:GIY-YIG nuclease family protein [Candidatus Microgenomates bacterium]
MIQVSLDKYTNITKLSKIKIDKKVFSKLPQTPGVYIFWKKVARKKDIPIYIGKSVNLKSRLSSYLAVHLGPKTKKMVKEAESISIIKVFSELESLLLEARLIRKFKPFYNIIAKDDKRPLYIVITKDEFPRVLSARRPKKNEFRAEFGPFPAGKNVKTILRLIRKIFPYSDHLTSKNKLRSKPCIYSQIGLCDPCPNTISSATEKTKYKQNIKNTKRLLQGKFSGVQKDLNTAMKKLSKEKKYEEAGKLRDQLKALNYITQPQIPTGEFLKNPNLEQDVRSEEIKSLSSMLACGGLKPKTLQRIECFDIAHIAGVNPTASMVVAINGQMENSKYRHFKIKQKKTQSDFDSMVEVAKRRRNNIAKWGTPDLIVVDGGLAQVKAFNQIFMEPLQKKKIPVVGIAKHPDRLIFSEGKKVKLTGSTLRLTQRLRDEAHRFARRYHHLLMKKSLYAS